MMKRTSILFMLVLLLFSNMSFANSDIDIVQEEMIIEPYDSINGDDYWTATRNYTGTNRRFVKYLTSSWAYSDRYTWTNSVSYGWSVTSGISDSYSYIKTNFSWTLSASETYSVAISIPADETRLSKLGFYADYKYYSVTSKLHDWWTGAIIDTESGTAYDPTSETSLIVRYE